MSILYYRLRDRYARLYTKYVAEVNFVHINKTGGTSIEKALGLPFLHLTALELRELVGLRRWEERLSFAFVRNPWDKVASHYHYRVLTNQTRLRENPIEFNAWVRMTYGDQRPPLYDQPKMFMPQVDWISDSSGQVIVAFIGRFERLEDDFKEICRLIGCSGQLPHLKSSGRGDYRNLYSSEAAEIVARRFEPDIAKFGYTFDR